jgi:hypothetical protein
MSELKIIQKMINRDRNADKLPATAKLRNQIGSTIRKRQARFLFFVRVTRNSRAQQFVCATQSVGQRAEHLECDIRIVRTNERNASRERIANRASSITLRISRTLAPVDDRHLTEEVALREFRQRQFLIVVVANTDPHAPALDQVHRVALVALFEETRVLRHHFVGQQVAQLFAASSSREANSGTERSASSVI